MHDKPLLVEKRDSICTVTINRPGKQNTLFPGLLEDMRDIFRSLENDPTVHVVVLRGAGEKVFCAGYDLSIIPAAVEGATDKMTQGQAVTREEDLLNVAMEAICDCRCPVIAMIFGPCVGAGCDLASACDLRLASSTSRFAIPAARRGVIYPPDSIRRVMSLIGVGATRELVFTADFIDAARAKEIGLVTRVVDATELVEATYALAGSISRNSPLALAASKKAIAKYVQAARLSPADEEDVQKLAMRCAMSEDFQEGIRAFLEKRQPRFQGK